MKNLLRLIFSGKSLKEIEEELREENERLKQRIEYLESEIKKLHLTDEVSKATKEIELIKGILAKDMDPQKRLSEFFSISLYIYSKQLSKLTRVLLILTTVLVILAIIQFIIVLT